MKLSLSLIADELQLDIIEQHMIYPDEPFHIAHWFIYQEAEPSDSENKLLLMTADHYNKAFKPNASAFICIGRPDNDYFKETDNYILLDGKYDFVTLITRVNDIFNKYQEMETDFLQLFYKEPSFQEFVDYMYPYFRNEIVVMNSDFYFIAHTQNEILLDEHSDLEVLKENRASLELINFFKNDINYSKIKNERNPFIYAASIFSTDCLCMNIFKNEKFAFRFVIMPVLHPLRAYDSALLKFFCGYIQQMYTQKEQHSYSSTKNSLKRVICQLLANEKVEIWQQYKAILLNRWKLEDLLLCICILPSQMDYYNDTIPYYCDSLMSSFPGICACEYGEHIVGVVNLSFYEDSESTFISKFVYYLRESNFKAGFSTSFRKLENIRMAWKQSIIALNLGLQNNPDIWNHKFEDYALEYMISQMYSDFDFKFLCSKGILKLREYDKHNQTEYYKTLKTYLENKENVVKTAETLFIHRGTMIYRLKRIKELTGMALESIDELLYLHLSIRMIEMNKDEL